MSLILEALRKLERDKDAPARGFVVMTHLPWARGGGRSRLVGIGALALALAVGALALTLWRGRTEKPAPPQVRALATAPPAAAPPAAAPPATTPPADHGSPPPPFEAKALAMESLRTSVATPAGASVPVVSDTPRPRPAAPPELRLSAISRRDDQPVAILNDRLVHEGDVFDGISVIRIGEAEVEVEVRGQRRVLRF